MTAPFVYRDTRRPHTPSGTRSGDRIAGYRCPTPGQLWERIGGRVPPLSERLHGALRRAHWRRLEAEEMNRPLDAPIGKAGSYRGLSRSGIIRAGVRVK